MSCNIPIVAIFIFGEKQMQNAREVKTSAMTLRFTDPYVIKIIDHAAKLLNQTRTGFLISAAQEKAEQIIKTKSAARAEVERIILSPEASIKVANRLLHPKKPSKYLVEAVKRYKDRDTPPSRETAKGANSGSRSLRIKK
jgi:uncharacterized protein (DUF1778 family)